MSNQTTNYGFTKPTADEFYDIAVQNDNWNKNDAQLLANLLAAKGYTDTKIQQLINAAPGALDTLKELADALGDDPNFAATITNSIAGINSSLSEKANQNLLINGDFKVWQRGTTFTPNSGYNYTADRWILSQGVVSGAKVEKMSSGGLKLSCLLTGYAKLEQRGEKSDFLRKYFDANNDITLSAKINGTVYSGKINTIDSNGVTIFSPKTIYSNSNFLIGITTANNANYDYSVVINLTSTSVQLEIEWVKLELGSVATPFTPKPYAEEETLCKRYYEKITTAFLGVGYFVNTTLGRIVFPYSVKKRIAPTLSTATVTSNNFIYSYKGVAYNVTVVSLVSNGVDVAYLQIVNDAVPDVNGAFGFQLNNGSWIAFDSEIY